MKKRLPPYFFGFLFALLLTLGLYETKSFEQTESSFHDLKAKLFSQKKFPSDNIKLIIIDQDSLKWVQEQQGLSWPWPRSFYSYLNKFLITANAKVVVYDMLFTEPSVYGVEDDLSFAQSLSHITSIGAAVFTEQKNSNVYQNTQTFYKETYCNKNTYIGNISSIPQIASQFSTQGIVNANIDSDGIIRKANLCYEFEGKKFATLPSATFELFHPIKNYTLRSDEPYINYYNSPFSYPAYSAKSIINSFAQIEEGLKPQIDPTKFKDSIVFVGVTALGLHDIKNSPLSENHPGVDIQATIYDNIQKDDFLYKTSKIILYFAVFIFGCLTLVLFFYIKRVYLIILFTTFLICVSFILSSWLYIEKNTLLSLSPIFSIILFTLLFSGITGYLTEGRQKQFIKNAFGQYLSPTVVQTLIDQPHALKLGGTPKELTIFFSDIAGFTSISEKMEPQKLVSFLNHYLDEMGDLILQYNGTIDKFEGDAIIAFWNAPIEQKGHAGLTIQSAISQIKKLNQLNTIFQKKYGVKINIRIGIHSGTVIVGNIGSSKRFDYSFIGDAGNTASRLEGANKFFKTQILFSEKTLALFTSSIEYRKIGTVILVGKKVPLKVYEPLLNDTLDSSDIQLFEKALTLFESMNYNEAKKIFEALSIKDPVSQNYLHIIQQINDGSLVWEKGLVLLEK